MKRDILMKMAKIFAVLLLFVSVAFVNTATFKIINRISGSSSNPGGLRIRVRPVWNGGNAGFVELDPNEETSLYNSGLNNVTAVIYEEMLPQTPDQKDKGVFSTRRYSANFDINALAVGGKIYIRSGGAIAFSFDTIAGNGVVKAQLHN